MFAILGLRSLYFVLAGVIGKFHLLKYGLSAVLAFVGVKMLVSEHLPDSDWHRRWVWWRGLLLASVLASLIIPAPTPPREPDPLTTPLAEAETSVP